VHILLVDDHTMFRQGLRFLLSDLMEGLQFYEAGSCEQALTIIAGNPVNLILLDLEMPGINGLEALNAVIRAAPTVPVAVLSGKEDPLLIRATIEAGASGFVPKSTSSAILVAALNLILAGGVYLPPNTLKELGSIVPSASAATSAHGQTSLLSKRQTAVLLRAIKGLPNKVIAVELSIAEGTVKTHLSGAFRVLGVRNRTEAVFAAAKLGLAPAPG
jgi:DNA-binding NarL/FixJ family response regulator